MHGHEGACESFDKNWFSDLASTQNVELLTAEVVLLNSLGSDTFVGGLVVQTLRQ